MKFSQELAAKVSSLQQTIDGANEQATSDLQTANEKLQQKDSEIQRISEELTLKRKEADVSTYVIGHIIGVITELCENNYSPIFKLFKFKRCLSVKLVHYVLTILVIQKELLY